MEYLKKFLIFIEDRNFKNHKGIDYKAIIRAYISNVGFLNKIVSKIKGVELMVSGGSTITQQLFRTLFIKNMHKRSISRKIVEIIASRFWLNYQLNKEEQLEIYLSSVRFDKNVFGIVEARKHFFNKKTELNKAKSFFLIERISVISGKILPKTRNIMQRALNEGVLDKNDKLELEKIYREKNKRY